MTLAVAASGKKTVLNGRLVNDRRRFLVLHGERPYDAVVEASGDNPYIALKLQLPLLLVAKTLIELADTPYPVLNTARTSELPAYCDELTEDLAGPLLRLLRAFDDPADCRMLAPYLLSIVAIGCGRYAQSVGDTRGYEARGGYALYRGQRRAAFWSRISHRK
ncbi:AraC family transcriptional regulator N-terminal domain-containing protein [Rhizobium leguminosarum]|nr:AraC family transcriptional regulator N-terminal domain-containing protein [Rhizobium leguminosarum]